MKRILALGLIGLVGLASLSGCGKSDGYKPIDPSLLPSPPIETLPAPPSQPIESSALPTPSPTTPASTGVAFNGEVVKITPVDLPPNYAAYESLDGSFVLVKQRAAIPSPVLADASARVDALPTVENANSQQDLTIISAWIDDLDSRLFAATGKHAAVVYSFPAVSNVDSKDEPQIKWGFRVSNGKNSTLQSQPVSTQATAISDAQKWIAESGSPDQYVVVSGSVQ
jgi:hypothetical protein